MNETEAIARHIVTAQHRPLPDEVLDKTRHHILDTLAAIVSGAVLPAGRAGAAMATRLGGPQEALCIGSGRLVGSAAAALSNAMSAHADETDDSHVGGRFHPGCAVVPAALAMAEATGASGAALTRAVALGYDVGARAVMALGFRSAKMPRFSTHTIGGNFGASAAAIALAGLDVRAAEFALSYTVQQTGGVPYWRRDADHVEKAFDFGGAGARNGVMAAIMVAAGWTGVTGTLTGEVSYLSAFGEDARPDALTDGLGERHEIMGAAIKKWCVGSPIQAALDAVTAIIEAHGIRADDVAGLVATMPDDRLHIVDDRDMPDVCLQHLLAVALIDGTVTFASAHNKSRMTDPAIQSLRTKMQLEPSEELTEARPPRQAVITITTRDGRTLRHHAKAVMGTPENPMSEAEVCAKARDLMAPALGEQTEPLIAMVLGLEELRDVRALRRRLGHVEAA